MRGDADMPNEQRHIKVLDKQISDLSDALAHLGRGTDLKELIKIIRKPGWTTPAEFAFSVAIIDSLRLHVDAIERLSGQLLEAAGQVGSKEFGADLDRGVSVRPRESQVNQTRAN